MLYNVKNNNTVFPQEIRFYLKAKSTRYLWEHFQGTSCTKLKLALNKNVYHDRVLWKWLRSGRRTVTIHKDVYKHRLHLHNATIVSKLQHPLAKWCSNALPYHRICLSNPTKKQLSSAPVILIKLVYKHASTCFVTIHMIMRFYHIWATTNTQ